MVQGHLALEDLEEPPLQVCLIGYLLSPVWVLTDPSSMDFSSLDLLGICRHSPVSLCRLCTQRIALRADSSSECPKGEKAGAALRARFSHWPAFFGIEGSFKTLLCGSAEEEESPCRTSFSRSILDIETQGS